MNPNTPQPTPEQPSATADATLDTAPAPEELITPAPAPTPLASAESDPVTPTEVSTEPAPIAPAPVAPEMIAPNPYATPSSDAPAPTQAVELGAAPALASPAAAQPVASSKKGLAITALVLSIIGAVIGVAWFVAAPLAIIAIILAIVSLVKRRGGKGMSIASLIVGGVALFIFVPFWAFLTLVAYGGIQDEARSRQESAEQRSLQLQQEAESDIEILEN